MNKEFIPKGGISYTVHYKTNADAIHVIHGIYGTLDDGCINSSFEISTFSDEAKRKALEILGLNEDYWRFADE